MSRSLVALVALSLVGCETPDKLCKSAECVAKSDTRCQERAPIVGAKCNFEGDCYYCTAEIETHASLYACDGSEWDQVDYAIDSRDCEGPADTATSPE